VIEFLGNLIPIFLMLCILGVLIFVHELGHFLACRFARVGVEKFSIGFGPEILKWQGKETRYAISAIPLGGFVKPQGESSEEVEKRGGKLQPGDFLAAAWWHRLLILIAGVAMNFLFAYLLFVVILVAGRPITPPVIGTVSEGMPAQVSGIQAGDEITHVNGLDVRSWQELRMEIVTGDGSPYAFTVLREDEILEVVVTPAMGEGPDRFGEMADVPQIGILPSKEPRIERYPLGDALLRAAKAEWFLIRMTYEALWLLVTRKLPAKALMGPIGIVSVAQTAAEMGMVPLLQFAALLSVSLGVINLLPIPALDGGHVFFLAIEVIRRKPLNHAIQERLTQVGFCLLLFLIVFVSYNDLMRLDIVGKIKGFFLS
jgi:regulator of sigma E protease